MGEFWNYALSALGWLAEQIVPYTFRFVAAVIIFFVGFKLVNVLVKKIKEAKKFKNVDPSAASFITSFISIGLKIVIIVSVVAILGVPMSSVIALIASAGVAIGLAVQGALSNLVGGLMILLFKPFRVGDYIEAQGASGTVREISVFYTVVLTVDNRVVTVPNGGLTNSVITNYSTEDLRRVDIDFTADYETDVATVKAILLAVAKNSPKALKDPAPVAVITNCGKNGAEFSLRVWCAKEDYWDVRFGLIEGVRNAFKAAEINIPYDQLEVHLKK